MSFGLGAWSRRLASILAVVFLIFLAADPVYATIRSMLTVSYTPNDDYGVSSCSLWTNISGSFILNQTSSSITMGATNTFYVYHVPVGYYKLQVACLDSAGQGGYSGYAYISVTTTTTTTMATTTTTVATTTTTTHATTTTNCYAACGSPESGIASEGDLCLYGGTPDCTYDDDACVAWTPPTGICCPPGYSCGFYNGGHYMCLQPCHAANWGERTWICNSGGSWTACP